MFGVGDGHDPSGSLTFDAHGNLYGTTFFGGAYSNCYGGESGCGTVFELMPQVGGGWSEQILHNFNNNGVDGNEPYSSVTFDAAGNLYGTTSLGGTYLNCFGNGFGCGTVFELSPTAGGGWTERVLHSFGGGTDGFDPRSSLIFDATGNLYGMTAYGGTHNSGTAFKLVRGGNKWAEKILYNFGATLVDATVPIAGPVLDASGNLYGTTGFGGANGTIYDGGTVFEIKP